MKPRIIFICFFIISHSKQFFFTNHLWVDFLFVCVDIWFFLVVMYNFAQMAILRLINFYAKVENLLLT